MRFEYQRHGRYFAQIPGGLEAEAVAELEALGAREVTPGHRGASFTADPTALYGIVYQARLVSRVNAPLLAVRCRSSDGLYSYAREIPYEQFLQPSESFAVRADVSGPYHSHSHYAALRVKDAIVDRFRERTGARPDVERQEPDVWFHLHVRDDAMTLSLDLAGGALHRRGYRLRAGEAPMQETLAAAIVRLSGWDGERPLHDPMCGAGTLLAEAVMAWCRVPAAHLRTRFAFERLPDFELQTWVAVRSAADAAIRALPPGLVSGSDVDPEAIAAARENLARLPSGEHVGLECRDFRALEGLPERTLLTNPPYGLRLGEPEAAGLLLGELGDFFKRKCTGSTAFVYVGDRALVARVGLRPAWRRPLVSGALDGRLCRFDLKAGPWSGPRGGDPGTSDDHEQSE